jgi:hypothetical protein
LVVDETHIVAPTAVGERQIPDGADREAGARDRVIALSCLICERVSISPTLRAPDVVTAAMADFKPRWLS